MVAPKWVHDNCYKYEPWHLRYVGLKLAKYLHENGLTLEEYHLNKDFKR